MNLDTHWIDYCTYQTDQDFVQCFGSWVVPRLKNRKISSPQELSLRKLDLWVVEQVGLLNHPFIWKNYARFLELDRFTPIFFEEKIQHQDVTSIIPSINHPSINQVTFFPRGIARFMVVKQTKILTINGANGTKLQMEQHLLHCKILKQFSFFLFPRNIARWNKNGKSISNLPYLSNTFEN